MATVWVECWKCEGCGHRWIKGELYPAQCAKCRSRKWDAKGNAQVASADYKLTVGESRPVIHDGGVSQYTRTDGVANFAGLERSKMNPAMATLLAKVPAVAPEPIMEREPCAYTEYDGETGETYRCGLAKHSGKVRHTRGAKV